MENVTFSQFDFHPEIAKALKTCGYEKPTPVQARCIPEVLNGHDLVASAQTGTGKTAAFVLPALHRLSETKSAKKPRVLILTPTRELAAQIQVAAGKYGKFMRFNIVSLVGGMPYRQQLRDLSRPVDVIVATPGRLMDHMENKRLDLSEIEMLILDEADRMLDMGFIDDVQHIASKTPKDRQTLLFSATVDNQLTNVVKSLLKSPIRIDLSSEKMAPAKIQQTVYIADHVQHKNRLLEHFLDEGNIFKGIIFTATKISADRLAAEIEEMGFAADALHGDLKQSQRNRTVEKLKRGKIQFLVATDVAARGIDISDVTHVINYDLPRFSEDYVHRIGRTGRAGREGSAISFVMPTDARHLQNIERYIGQKIPREVVSGMEPKKQLNENASTGKKKKFGGGKQRGKSFSFGGKGKSEKKSYRDAAPKKSGSKKEFARDEMPRKKSFKQAAAKNDSPRLGSFNDAVREDAPRKKSFGGKKDENFDRRSFKKDDAPRKGSFKSDGKKDRSSRRDSFKGAESRDGGSRRSSFKDDGKREGFSRRDSFKGAESRDGGSRRGSFKGDSKREDFSRRDSFKGAESRDGGSRRGSFKDDGKREGFSRRDSFKGVESRDGGARRGSFKDDGKREGFSRRDSFKGAESRDGGARRGSFKSDGKREGSSRRDSFKSAESRSGSSRKSSFKSDGSRQKGSFKSDDARGSRKRFEKSVGRSR